MARCRSILTMMANRCFALLLLALCLLFAGCGANESVLRSGREDTNADRAAPQVPSFDQEIAAMRTAGFSFIYVLRRKDGAPISPEDKSVIRVQTTQANRRVSADDGRAVIIGSNFQLSEQNMSVISQRFAVENYSPAPGQAAISPTVDTNSDPARNR